MALKRWRLVYSDPLPGKMNMAIDEALMRSVAKGGPPTLRFYGWSPPAISIGYFQKIDDELNLQACRQLGIDVVRRPTGGRAVLHDVEVTYAIVVPEENALIPKGITESYKKLSRGMVAGLAELGLPAQMVSLTRQKPRPEPPSPGTPANSTTSTTSRTGQFQLTVEMPDTRDASVVCFDAPSWYEVAIRGKKVIGSAQVRRHGVLLQHGSIPLALDADALFACMRLPSPAVRERLKKSFLAKATSVGAELGRRVTFEEVAHVLQKGIADELGVTMVSGEIQPEEMAEARDLVSTYEHDSSS